MNEGLTSIERSGLPGKCKRWCLQFGLLSRLMWPLTVYEVAITHVEAMERKISGMCRKWLGVPRSLTLAALYGHSSKLALPMTSITEEFKVTKAKLHLTLHDSADPVISNVAPEVKFGRKWQAADAVEEAISSLQHKEIVGATQAGRQGLGSQEQVWWSRAQSKSRRELVGGELRSFEEHKRLTKAVGQSKQVALTRWEGVEQKKLTWSDLWSMEQHGISFHLRSVYDLLRNPANLTQWKLANSSRCGMCEGHGTLQIILSACPRALGQGMYTWRHDQVLLVIAKAVEKAAEVANQESGESDEDRHIQFVSKGGGTDQKAGRPLKRVKILQGSCNWKVESDLSGRLVFPVAAANTHLRPDLVIWSGTARVLIIGELTVPWEEHMKEANERKKNKYASLMTECTEKQWQVHCLPFEVGCRGFVGTSLMTFLHKLGITHRERKSVCKAASDAALRASTWIWAKHRNGPS